MRGKSTQTHQKFCLKSKKQNKQQKRKIMNLNLAIPFFPVHTHKRNI